MTSRDFCYWLQGFFELSGGGGELNQAQVGNVRKHLALVFLHEIDPSAGPPEHQAKLNEAHGGPAAGIPSCPACNKAGGHHPWCQSSGTGGGGNGPVYRC